MTPEEAAKLTHFEHPCTCGGHAWRMSNRPEGNPHMRWCPQKPQYDEWWKAMHSTEAGNGSL